MYYYTTTGGQQGGKGEGQISPFNALMTSLSATVGTGNIAGVSTAICGVVGLQKLPLNIGTLIHLIRETEDGCEIFTTSPSGLHKPYAA